MMRVHPLHCLPGWSFTSSIFSELVSHLPARLEPRLWELPGHGGSPDPAANTLDGVVTAQVSNIGSVAAGNNDKSRAEDGSIWLGWSLGGTIAVDMWRRELPIKALIMIAATPRFCVAEDWSDAVQRSDLEAMIEALGKNPQAVVKRFRSNLAKASSADRQAVRGVGQATQAGLAAGLNALLEADLRSVLDSLSEREVPSLWIGGDRDPLVPAAALECAAQLAGGESCIIPEAGHLPHVTHSLTVAELIDDFVQRRISEPID
ncbi:alpha/beta fold hydrolase [Halorhodospira halochloris]|uniref:Biotin synthesis protein BioH n=1 Tax=Halorhodospira halochloris TaxID=1052 RepID=A0A0X8X7K0_HALHR|nr:alpha/beta fold hydrolase [Halorhodospira halochloris]MCG5529412.1 alpha/beta fold hydrolase [Halorhodospira halochloris]BAU56433.1 biotin synthesis protein BioH [Halorhodospira halochloris]